MKLHEVNCSCKTCMNRRRIIERVCLPAQGRGNQKRNHDYHSITQSAWTRELKRMVAGTFQKCGRILDMSSTNFNEQLGGRIGSPVSQPFDENALQEMIESPKKEAYMGPTWRTKSPLGYQFGEESIESLLELYTFHKKLENELILICEEALPLDVKVQSIKAKIQDVNKLHKKRYEESRHGEGFNRRYRQISTGAKHSPWIIYFRQFEVPYRDLLSAMIAEIKRLEVLERQNTIDRFMKIGPDMPDYLAEAMADEIISEQEAAEIFRNGWHRNDVSSEVLAAFLRSKTPMKNTLLRSKTPVKNNNEQSLILDFQTAQWLHAHNEHDSLILAILRSEMDMEAARELLNSDFRNHPNATNAIVAGNPIETVAMMYGIISQPIEAEEETSPSLPLQQVNEDTTSSQKNMEWAREFDV